MKKHIYNILFFFSIFIIILFIKLAIPLNDLDEIWNYNIARNIADGLIPYKDISMITSPLLGMITAIFLKLIANELIVTRILSAILATLILYSLHQTMNILKINKNINYLVVIVLLIILNGYFCLDYNWAVALMGIIILNLELLNIENREKDKSNFKYDFLIGNLVGISICFKQSIGLLIAIIAILYNLIFIQRRKDIVEFTKRTIIRICGIFLPISILILYLFYNNALYEFIDYCILGIKTFNNSIPYINLIKEKDILLKIIAILIPTIYLVTSIKIIINVKKKKNIKILFTILGYSISLFAITFPISNGIHLLIGSLPSLILFVYILNATIMKYLKFKIKIDDIFIKIVLFIFLIILLIGTVSNFYKTYKEYGLSKDLNHFKYISIPKSLIDSIKDMDSYLLNCNNKVYILDSTAAVYMIPIDKYNKDYDMFNLGNFGGRGEFGKIKDLEEENNIIVLIKNDSTIRNWQNPEQVRKYIQENWTKIDTISVFDVYRKGI